MQRNCKHSADDDALIKRTDDRADVEQTIG